MPRSHRTGPNRARRVPVTAAADSSGTLQRRQRATRARHTNKAASMHPAIVTNLSDSVAVLVHYHDTFGKDEDRAGGRSWGPKVRERLDTVEHLTDTVELLTADTGLADADRAALQAAGTQLIDTFVHAATAVNEHAATTASRVVRLGARLRVLAG